MIPLVAGLLAGGSAVSLVAAFAGRRSSAVAAMLGGRPERRRPSATVAVGRRLAASPLLRRITRIDRLEMAIAASGRSVSVSDVVSIKCAGAVAAILAMVLLLGAEGGPAAIIAGAGAFALPDLTLGRAARARRRAADLEVTQFLDLLAAASSAGLAAPAAIRRATTGVRGPLSEELDAAAAMVDVGGRWGEQLARIADRLVLPDLRAAVVVLARTEALGSSLAEGLHDLAVDVRGARRARATERARTAPVKMLFPLVFMVLPAFLLLTVVPVLIATIRSLS